MFRRSSQSAHHPPRRIFSRRPLLRRPRMFAVLPTLLTLGNAVCGFGAITFAAKVVDPATASDFLFIAGLLIFAAMVFDVLDGSAARWANQASEFGAELDSLCDAISFGVAPAFIMMKFSPVYHPRVLWVIGVLYVVCAVLRLARFNVETGEEDSHDSFSGLPSPAAAGVVASFAIALPSVGQLTAPDMTTATRAVGDSVIQAAEWTLPVVTLLAACLMVSRIRYPHIVNQWFRGKRSYHQLLQLIFALIAVFALHELALPLILCFFAFGAPIRALWNDLGQRFFSPFPVTTPEQPADDEAQKPNG